MNSQVSGVLLRDWSRLARRLGVNNIEELRNRFREQNSSLFDILVQILELWMCRVGRAATLEELIKSLELENMNAFAGNIVKF